MTNLITVLLITNLTATGHGGKVRERDWQLCANDQHFHGKTEQYTNAGRCDIVTDKYAIEVDYIGNADQAYAQAVKYAEALNLKPAIAIITDRPSILSITDPPIKTFLLSPVRGKTMTKL